MKKRTVVAASASVLAVAGLLPQVASSSASPKPPTPSPARLATPASSARAGATSNYDARQPASKQARAAVANAALRADARPAAQALHAALGDQSVVDMDGTTGTPRIVAKLNGFLTRPSTAAPARIALDYVKAHDGVFGLRPSDFSGLRLARTYVDVAGTTHLSWVQTVHGLPLFDNGLKAAVTKDGRLINVEGSPVAGLRAPAAPATFTARQAVVAAKANLGAPSTAPVRGDVASRVLFATAGGTRAAYQVTVMSTATPSLLVVDARSGRVLYRESLTADAAAPSSTAAKPAKGDERALVFRNYPGAARGGKAIKVDLTKHGWLPAKSVVLFGNNAHTYTDVNDNDAPGPKEEVGPRPNGSYVFPQHRFYPGKEPCKKHVCTWKPNTNFSWRANRRQTATQNFYFINTYHDHLRAKPIGFTEAAGNFQEVNHSRRGKGGDPVQDEPLDGARVAGGLPDGAHIDNANFATPPDGQAPRMQMYLWHQPGRSYPKGDPFIASAGSDEADIVYHEYTHGLSHRLVVDANNVPALDSQQGASMGEAWSDWYALDFLLDEHLMKNGPRPDVEVGKYVLPRENFRTEPTDCRVHSLRTYCPGSRGAGHGGYTYGDFGKILGFPEVHADGEIWAQTLWDLRDALGSKRTEAIVTRGMELSPTYPSYLDMRNAIIQADVADFHRADVPTIWRVFAHRGMGYFAGSLGGNDTHPVEDFSLPPGANHPRGWVHGRVVDSKTGKPVKGALVGFGGHDSGFPGSYVARTNAKGGYVIKRIFTGTYPDVYAGGAGYNSDVVTLKVHKGGNVKNWSLARDWAASSGGASIAGTNGDDSAAYGCGAAALIDQQLLNGWSTFRDPAGKFATIKLPRAVDISSLQIDPSGSCGDDLVASAGPYTVQTSTDGKTFVTAASGTFTKSDTGHLTAVPLAAGTNRGVRYVRYTILGNQAAQRGVNCSNLNNDEGCPWFDSEELEVFGTAAG